MNLLRICTAKDNVRPNIDPVVLFKIVLIQHIYGIHSLRRTLEKVWMNMAYRWFIGYPLNEQIPHFSTVSYNFKHRFNTASVEYIFRLVLDECFDDVICPEYKALHYSTTNRDGYCEYKKPLLSVCRLSHKSDVYTKCQVRKTVTRHI